MLDKAILPISHDFPLLKKWGHVGHVSLSAWLPTNSLSICCLVSLYLTNYLIPDEHIKQHFFAYSGFEMNISAEYHELYTCSPLCSQHIRPSCRDNLPIARCLLSFRLAPENNVSNQKHYCQEDKYIISSSISRTKAPVSSSESTIGIY